MNKSFPGGGGASRPRPGAAGVEGAEVSPLLIRGCTFLQLGGVGSTCAAGLGPLRTPGLACDTPRLGPQLLSLLPGLLRTRSPWIWGSEAAAGWTEAAGQEESRLRLGVTVRPLRSRGPCLWTLPALPASEPASPSVCPPPHLSLGQCLQRWARSRVGSVITRLMVGTASAGHGA